MCVRIFAAMLMLAMLASNASAGKTEVKSDGRASFDSFKSYAWHPGTPARRSEPQAQLVEIVDRALAVKGLFKAAADESPDLFVVTHVLVDYQSLAKLEDDEYWKFIKDVTSFSPYQLGAGTLVIDLIDAKADLIVWRGVSSSEVSGSSKKVMRKVDKAVTKLFEQYPGN